MGGDAIQALAAELSWRRTVPGDRLRQMLASGYTATKVRPVRVPGLTPGRFVFRAAPASGEDRLSARDGPSRPVSKAQRALRLDLQAGPKLHELRDELVKLLRINRSAPVHDVDKRLIPRTTGRHDKEPKPEGFNIGS